MSEADMSHCSMSEFPGLLVESADLPPQQYENWSQRMFARRQQLEKDAVVNFKSLVEKRQDAMQQNTFWKKRTGLFSEASFRELAQLHLLASHTAVHPWEFSKINPFVLQMFLSRTYPFPTHEVSRYQTYIWRFQLTKIKHAITMRTGPQEYKAILDREFEKMRNAQSGGHDSEWKRDFENDTLPEFQALVEIKMLTAICGSMAEAGCVQFAPPVSARELVVMNSYFAHNKPSEKCDLEFLKRQMVRVKALYPQETLKNCVFTRLGYMMGKEFWKSRLKNENFEKLRKIAEIHFLLSRSICWEKDSDFEMFVQTNFNQCVCTLNDVISALAVLDSEQTFHALLQFLKLRLRAASDSQESELRDQLLTILTTNVETLFHVCKKTQVGSHAKKITTSEFFSLTEEGKARIHQTPEQKSSERHIHFI